MLAYTTIYVLQNLRYSHYMKIQQNSARKSRRRYTTITVLHSKKGLLFQQKAKSLDINCCVHYKVLYKSSDLIFNVKILHPGKPPMSLKFEGKRKMKRLKEKTKEKLNISEEKAKRSKENEQLILKSEVKNEKNIL